MSDVFRIDQADNIIQPRLPPAIWDQLSGFRALPSLIDGVLLYDDIMGPFYGNNFILNKVVPEAWRFQMLVFTLYLADDRNGGDPLGGLTLGNLQALCKSQEIASPGRVFAYLNLMRAGGYLSRKASPDDRRIIHLEPTDRLMATVEAWNHNIFAIIDRIAPESGFIAARALNAGLGRHMRWHSTRRILEGWRPVDGFDEVMHFVAKDGGWMLLARLVAITLRQNRDKLTPVSINLAAFSAEFGISRSHARRILEGAYERDLLDVPPRNGTHILLSPLLMCSFLGWFSSYFANYRACVLTPQ